MPGAQGRVPLRNLSESFAHVDSDAQRSKTPPRYEAMSWRRKLAYLKFSGPGNLNQLVEQEVLAPEFFALSMTGLMRSHCSSRLRPLSRNTINPGCAATSRSSMKSRAFAVTTAKSWSSDISIRHDLLDQLGQRAARIERIRRLQPIERPMLARCSHPAANASLCDPLLPLKGQALSRASRLFTEAREQSSICEVPSAEAWKVLYDFSFGNTLLK